MSKSYNLRNNTEVDAKFSPFDTANNTFSGNNQSYGSTTISQAKDGVMTPNVQAAIDDVAVMAQNQGINSVVTNTDGISPQGSPQIDSYKFAGTVLTAGKQTGEETFVDCFGFKVKAIVGDTATDFADKALDRLKEGMSKGIAFTKIVKSSTALSTIEVTYKDYQPHELEQYTNQGITITPTVLSPSKPGYGTWSLLGNTNIQLDGQKNPIKLYYFTRTS